LSKSVRRSLLHYPPENLTSPWLLFEAGALAKKDESRVCTYLFEVKYEDVIDPLSQFQHTLATQDDTKKLVGTINNALADSLEADRVARQFDKWWPDLHDRLKRILESPAPAVPERSPGEKIDEILTRVRALESVLVSREISDVSENLEGLQAEVRELMALQQVRLAARAQLADLSASAHSLSEAGERGVEYEMIQAQIAEAKANLRAVEARIDSVTKHDYLYLLKRLLDAITKGGVGRRLRLTDSITIGDARKRLDLRT
jgi:hypothetical protein